MAQVIVVVEVFVTQRKAEYPLTHQRLDLMLNQIGATTVAKTGGKPFHKPDRTIRGSKKDRSRVRSDRTTREICLDAARFYSGKLKPF
jgi:hypothetical protein